MRKSLFVLCSLVFATLQAIGVASRGARHSQRNFRRVLSPLLSTARGESTRNFEHSIASQRRLDRPTLFGALSRNHSRKKLEKMKVIELKELYQDITNQSAAAANLIGDRRKRKTWIDVIIAVAGEDVSTALEEQSIIELKEYYDMLAMHYGLSREPKGDNRKKATWIDAIHAAENLTGSAGIGPVLNASVINSHTDDDSLLQRKLNKMKVPELQRLHSRLARVLNMSSPGSRARRKETWIKPILDLSAGDLVAAAERLKIIGSPGEGVGVRSFWIDAIMQNELHPAGRDSLELASNNSNTSTLRRDLPDRVPTNFSALANQHPQLPVYADAQGYLPFEDPALEPWPEFRGETLQVFHPGLSKGGKRNPHTDVHYFTIVSNALRQPVIGVWAGKPIDKYPTGDRGSANFVQCKISGIEFAVDNDYANTGFAKGHLVADTDMKLFPKVEDPTDSCNEGTFTLCNVMPQNQGLNNGVWRSLELGARRCLTKRKRRGTFMSGPIFRKDNQRLCTRHGACSLSGSAAVPSCQELSQNPLLYTNKTYFQRCRRGGALIPDAFYKVIVLLPPPRPPMGGGLEVLWQVVPHLTPNTVCSGLDLAECLKVRQYCPSDSAPGPLDFVYGEKAKVMIVNQLAAHGLALPEALLASTMSEVKAKGWSDALLRGECGEISDEELGSLVKGFQGLSVDQGSPGGSTRRGQHDDDGDDDTLASKFGGISIASETDVGHASQLRGRIAGVDDLADAMQGINISKS